MPVCDKVGRHRRGFSLIESLVAVLILSIGILSVVALFVPGMKTVRKARNIKLATAAAEDKFEEMRAAGFDGITAANFPSEFEVPGFPGATGTISIAAYPASATKLKRATVDVYWPGEGGAAGTVHLESLFTLRGVQ